MDSRDDDKRAAISEEAAEWFIRLRDDDLGVADQYQYLLWLKESPAHVAEMLRICRLYVVLQVAQLRPANDGAAPASNVIDLMKREKQPQSTPARVRHWRAAAAVATVAVTGLLAVATMIARMDPTIETEAGEWRVMTLEDGSRAKLGPLTRVRISMSDAQRTVRLEGGEAVFEVAKDASRPFLVNADLAVVRAVGTAFEVAHRNGSVIVTVAEGVVEVTRGAEGRARNPSKRDLEGLSVSAGGQVAVAQSWPVAVKRVDADIELAWADGVLHFDTETVAEAVAEFNRRNRIQIIVTDQKLKRRPVRGPYNARDPEAFARTLATATPVVVIRDEPGLLRIEPRALPNISRNGGPSSDQ